MEKSIFNAVTILFLFAVVSCRNSDKNTTSDNTYVIETVGFGCDVNGNSELYPAGSLVVWGDIHSHTTYSGDALEKAGCTKTPKEAFEFARSVSLLDFVAVTDHAENIAPGNYSQLKWTNYITQIIDFQNANQKPIIFPAFEYTKNSVKLGGISPGNGHKNIIVYDVLHVPQRGYGSDVYDQPYYLWSFLESSNAKGFYMSIPHHPAKGSDYDNPIIPMKTDWSSSYVDYIIQPLVEIYSRHGSSESISCDDEQVNDFVADCSVDATLCKWLTDHNPGYKLGITGSTDTHFGTPGDVTEVQSNIDARLGYWTGGLTGVWVTETSRSNIWSNLKSKNCYGTSGSRLRLEFTIKLGSSIAKMGGTLQHTETLQTKNIGKANIHINALAEQGKTVSRIQIFRNGKVIYDTTSPLSGSKIHVDYLDNLDTDYAYYRVKVWQPSSNTLNKNIPFERVWSSPIWIEKR